VGGETRNRKGSKSWNEERLELRFEKGIPKKLKTKHRLLVLPLPVYKIN
jgi:hypothetical protein